MASLLRLVTAIIALAMLVGPASADASRPSKAKAQAPVALAKSVARRYWGATPCGGRVTVKTRQLRTTTLDGADAWATFATPTGANDLAAPAASYSRCKVLLTQARWPSRGSMHQDWDMLCMTMVHEYGHLLGHAHDETARSVMAPVFTDYSSEPQLCKSAR